MKLRISEGVLLQFIGDEAVVLHVATGTYFAVNQTGALAWRSLVQGGSLEDAVQEILQVYEVDEASLREDLEAFANDLVEKGLAEEIPI